MADALAAGNLRSYIKLQHDLVAGLPLHRHRCTRQSERCSTGSRNGRGPGFKYGPACGLRLCFDTHTVHPTTYFPLAKRPNGRKCHTRVIHESYRCHTQIIQVKNGPNRRTPENLCNKINRLDSNVSRAKHPGGQFTAAPAYDTPRQLFSKRHANLAPCDRPANRQARKSAPIPITVTKAKPPMIQKAKARPVIVEPLPRNGFST